MARTAAKSIRILLLDDHALFRASVARLLQAERGFEVVADCSSCADALQIIKSREIDIVLLDLDLGTERGADFLENLRTEGFQGKVLLVTAGVIERDVPALIRKGISGVFLKHGYPADLIKGIREAMAGKALFNQEFLSKALETTEEPDAPQSGVRLTKRDRSVLSLVFEGLPNKQIGERLQISESAVKACLQQLFAKTGVRTRSQLVRIALEHYRDQI